MEFEQTAARDVSGESVESESKNSYQERRQCFHTIYDLRCPIYAVLVNRARKPWITYTSSRRDASRDFRFTMYDLRADLRIRLPGTA